MSKIELAYEKSKDLRGKTVTITGLSSLGTILAESMVRAGINLRIVDMGRIEEADLEMGTLFEAEQLTKFKAKEAKAHLEKINPEAKVKSFHETLKEANAFLLDSDLIIDCTQDWETSKLIIGHAKKSKKPLIYTKLAGTKGLVLADKKPLKITKLEGHAEKLKDEGLLPGTVHMAAALVLTKAFKILTGEKYSNKLYSYDSLSLNKKEITL